jgi:uncharacterized protein (DUF2141 family)
MMTRLRTILSVLFSLPLITSLARAADPTITVSNAHSCAGSVFVVLYDDSDASFMKPTLAEATPSKGRVKVVIHDTPAGKYVVASHHDDDDSGKFNHNTLGIPTEGFRSSHDAQEITGPPKQRLNLTASPAR